jgi:hypothetical protein
MPVLHKRSRISPEVAARWAKWQSTPVSEKYLPLDARQMGYTVVRVAPPAREAFLDMVGLLTAYARLVQQEDCPDNVHNAWQDWHTEVRRLRAMLEGMLHAPAHS